MSQHVHKYRRVDKGRDKPYFVMECALPGCTHYIAMRSKTTCPSLMGKVSVCNCCGDRFVLDRRALTQAKPRCVACVKSPKQDDLDKAARFFSELEGNIADDSI